MFGNMGWITTTTQSENAESVERLSVCSPAIAGFSFLRHSSNWIRHHNSSVIDAGSSPAWRAI